MSDQYNHMNLIGPLKNMNFSLLSFKRRLYDNDFWPVSLGDLSKMLGAWNGFSANYRESCDRLFSAFGHVTGVPDLINENSSKQF